MKPFSAYTVGNGFVFINHNLHGLRALAKSQNICYNIIIFSD